MRNNTDEITSSYTIGDDLKFGYARVSTADQNLEQQISELNAAGCAEVFTDIASGAKSDRPGLSKLQSKLRDGDILIVCKLDRLGRSMSDLIESVEDLKNKGVGFKSLKDPIDTTTPSGRMIFGVFASLAEFELDPIRERTNAGLKAARARGRLGGRKPCLNSSQIKSMLTLYNSNEYSVAEICRQVNISRKTFYNYLNSSIN